MSDEFQLTAGHFVKLVNANVYVVATHDSRVPVRAYVFLGDSLRKDLWSIRVRIQTLTIVCIVKTIVRVKFYAPSLRMLQIRGDTVRRLLLTCGPDLNKGRSVLSGVLFIYVVLCSGSLATCFGG